MLKFLGPVRRAVACPTVRPLRVARAFSSGSAPSKPASPGPVAVLKPINKHTDESWLLKLTKRPEETPKSWVVRTLFGFADARWIQNLMLRMGYADVRVAKLVVNACAKRTAHPDWYTHCGVENNFSGQLAVGTMHIWMCHMKMRDMKASKRQISAMYEILWEDLELRIYNEGVHVISLKKHLVTVRQLVYGSLLAYDRCLVMAERGDGDPLLGAIWRNVYEGRLDMDKAHLVQMRDYMLSELDRVRAMNEEDFVAGLLTWSPPPSAPPRRSEEADQLDDSYADTKMFANEVQKTWKS